MLLAKQHSTRNDVDKSKSMVIKVDLSNFENLNFQRDDNFYVARNFFFFFACGAMERSTGTMSVN